MSFKLLNKEHSRDRDLELRKKNHLFGTWTKNNKNYDTTFSKIQST